MYKTNQQAWNEVMNTITRMQRLSQITVELYGQETFKGLTKEQRDQVYEQYGLV